MVNYLQSVKRILRRLQIKPDFSDLDTHTPTQSPRRSRASDEMDEVFLPDSHHLGIGWKPCNKPIPKRKLNIVAHAGSGSPKRPLSIARSMPISPTAPSIEKQSMKLSDLQVKLGMLTSELMAMKKSDQDIAKQLLNIHSEVTLLKVKKSCSKHGELLDEAIYEAEVADKFPEMCDFNRKSMNQLLTKRGVTRMNISTRRFSCS